MTLGKTLTVGDTVHFHAARFTEPVAAIVAAITPTGEKCRVSLTIFPPGAAPESHTGVEHMSAVEQACAVLATAKNNGPSDFLTVQQRQAAAGLVRLGTNGCWDWPVDSAPIALSTKHLKEIS